MPVLGTPRLLLESISLALVEAAFRGDRAELERLTNASVPESWPGRGLVERAFSADIERIRAEPEVRLWGDRLVITRAPRVVVGSVIFHGRPEDGIAEVGYGVEDRWQRQGFASEATRACVEWALAQHDVHTVTATTPPWHTASIRVLERSGLVKVGLEGHEMLGEVVRFSRRR
jgi:RimJ/RimL family protein N-acetyltransferase